MSCEALNDLNKLIKFYDAQFVIDHQVSSIVMPSHQLFASGLLHWLNVPEEAVGFTHMKEVSDCLILAYLRTKDEVMSDEFECLYKNFWDTLHSVEIQRGSEIPKLMNDNVKGWIGTNPIYAFLFISCCHGGASMVRFDGLLTTFRSYAPYFLKKAYKYQQDYSKTFLERLCLVARKLIVASSNLEIEDIFTPSIKERQQIGYLALRITDAKSASIFEISNKTYVTDLLFREGRKEITKGKHQKHKGFNTMKRWAEYEDWLNAYTPIDYPNIDLGNDFFRIINTKRKVYYSQQIDYKKRGVSEAEVEECGESHVDYVDKDGLELPAEFFTNPWKAKRNAGIKIEFTTFDSVKLVWEKDVLSKRVIKETLRRLQVQKHDVASVVLLSLMMGIKEKDLKNIYCNQIPGNDVVDIDLEVIESSTKGFNYDSKNGIFWSFHDYASRSDKFIKLVEYKELKLPSCLLEILPDLHPSERMLSPKNIREAKVFLKSLGRDGIDKVTLSRLVKTFNAYFISSFGLPVLFADILSGDTRFHLESQHYYVTQDLKNLTQQWHIAVQDFLSEYLSPNLLANRNTPAKTYQLPQTQLSASSEYIGAKNTPGKIRLKKHFGSLYDVFPHTEEELVKADEHQWNAYIAYLYGMFSVCTGQRPLRDPIPNFDEICLENGVIHITDKNSHYHREERCVVLVPVLLDALKLHVKLMPKWREKVMLDDALDVPSESTFFPVINNQKTIVPATPKVLDQVIDPLLAIHYIQDLKNGFRHFIISALFNCGTEQPVIDWVSGHRCQGMEHESMFSPVQWGCIAKTVRADINDSVVKVLNLKVPYNV